MKQKIMIIRLFTLVKKLSIITESHDVAIIKLSPLEKKEKEKRSGQ